MKIYLQTQTNTKTIRIRKEKQLKNIVDLKILLCLESE